MHFFNDLTPERGWDWIRKLEAIPTSESRASQETPKKVEPSVSKKGSDQHPHAVPKTSSPDKPKSNLQKLAYIDDEVQTFEVLTAVSDCL